MVDVEVIDDPAAAVVALEPIRSRLLAELAEPASAATLAARLGIARQKVNYHLRALEAHELVRVAGDAQWGGLTERLLVASAASYVVSPRALGPVALDPDRDVPTALRQLSHRPGRPHRGRGRRSAAPVTGSQQAPGDAVAGHRDPVPVGGRSRRLQQRARPARDGPRLPLPRRLGPRRPRASTGGHGAPAAARVATCTCKGGTPCQ